MVGTTHVPQVWLQDPCSPSNLSQAKMRVGGGVNFAGGGTFDSMWVIKNSTNPPTYGMQLQQVCVGSQMYLSSSTIMRLIANDTIQVYCYQNSGSALHVGSLGSGTARLEITKNFNF